MSKRILLIAGIGALHLLSSKGVFGQVKTDTVEPFLPRETVTKGWYVVIEPDSAFDDYCRRLRVAREKDPEWFREYARNHQGETSAPYDEHFGVGKEEYEHFLEPMNQYREVKRLEIKIQRSDQKGVTQLDFRGDNLLLTNVAVTLEDKTVKTPLDILPKRDFVDVQKASLPPGRHRGLLFVTSDAKIGATKRRESLFIGELKDKNSGIIHYAINTPGQVKMIYIEFAKE